MVRKLKALLLLLVLLVPVVQREIHTFQHRNDIACSATDSKHLHEQHHYCKLCDFSIPAHLTGISVDAPVSHQSVVFISPDFVKVLFSSDPDSGGPSRAPPFS